MNYQTLKSIALFLLVLALGFTAVNQGMGFFYKIELLKTPCKLCAELNPLVQECVYEKRASYFISGQNWSDPFEERKLNINVSELNLNP